MLELYCHCYAPSKQNLPFFMELVNGVRMITTPNRRDRQAFFQQLENQPDVLCGQKYHADCRV